MTVLTVRYDEWGRGRLYRHDSGKRCCLGFGCRVLGATDEKMAGVGLPYEIQMQWAFEKRFGLTQAAQDNAALLNDRFHKHMGLGNIDVARKYLAKLRTLFRDHGTTLRIVGLPAELR